MSMISEQVKHLKELSDTARSNVYSFEALSQSLREAADTIEFLSAKLQVANMEQNKILEEIREKAQELSRQHWGDDERHLVGKGVQCMCVQAENIIKANMERSVDDCDGWVLCSAGNMPDIGSTVLIQFKSDMNGITGDDDSTFDISYLRSSDNSEWFCSTGKYPIKDVKAWKPIKSYHEP